MYDTSLFIFRRDLRLYDNTALIEALKNSKKVIPVFIFTPTQLTKNKLKSSNCVQFMIESLKELNDELKKKGGKLYYFFDEPDVALKNILSEKNIDAVYVNRDYTLYSKKRDNKLEKICKSNDVEFLSYDDSLLLPLHSVLTGSSTVYKVFTPFFNKAKGLPVAKPDANSRKNYYSGPLKGVYKGNIDKFYEHNPDLHVNGGRSAGKKILKNLKEHKDYDKTRDTPSIETTHLSAYNKFGCVSIREVYWAFVDQLGKNNGLVRQLYWRDFYYNLGAEFDHIWQGKPFYEKYDKIKWFGPVSHFNKWKSGKTGYPIIDAAMRQLNQTGYMHNRCRLLVANFLIKLLGVNWKKGEYYFAQQLVDYDPNQNNGNWQWVAGSGAVSEQSTRIYNPWTQTRKIDPKCEYIKRWLPELEDVPESDIFKWNVTYVEYEVDYPKPIIDYKTAREKGLKMYGSLK